ncbi:MAG: ABC transporter substrate-binding protein [Chloroflexi bacterium]|nr:ABC transporter substrate-binding protein [Chloroflexota bacterium]
MRALLAALLTSAALTAAACSAQAPTATPPPPGTLTHTPAPTAGPPPAGTLRVAVTGAAPHLDLHRVVSEWATLFGPGPAYSRLLRFVSGPRASLPSLAVECDLCEEWRVVDALTYEFDLHPEARWQDAEGFASRLLTPQDVVFSLKRLRADGSPHASLLAAVDGITIIGARTVRLSLRYPDADLPQKLASPYAVVLAPDALDGVDVRSGRVVGSGPWRFEQKLSGGVELTAWEGYFRPGEPAASAVVFQPAVRADVAAGLLRSGRVDMARVSEEEWRALPAGEFRSVVVQRQGRGIVLGLNARRAPFDDARVRRAAFLALDPHAALAEVFGIGMVGIGVPLIDPSWALDEGTLRAAFADPEGAAALLREAGDARPSITLVVANFGPAYLAHGEALAADLRGAGFDVRVEPVSRNAYLTRVWRERDFDAFVGPLPPTDTTSAFLLSLLHSEGSSNVTGAADAALDDLIERQAAETDVRARGELVRAAQEAALEGAWLFMPVITAERWAFSARIGGVVAAMPAGAGDLWKYVRVEEVAPGG